MVQVLVDVLFPVFAIVGIGFALARLVDVEASTLTTLAYWVLGPAFVFDILSGAQIDPDVVAKVVASTVITMMVVGAVVGLTMRAAGVSFSTVSASVLTSIHGNVGNFGLAISAFALGEEALPIAGIVMVTINTVGIVTGVGLATLRRGSWRRAVLTAVTSPLALAVIPALAVNLTGTSLPLWLDRPVGLVAAAMIPVMLITLGVQLAGMGRTLPSGLVAAPMTAKLVVAPLIAWLVVGLVDLGGLAGSVVVLQAAMPAAVFTSLIALEHDLEPDYVTAVVLAGTLVSALSLPVVITLL